MRHKPTIYCPICGSEDCEFYFFGYNGEMVGCSDCLTREDAFEHEIELIEEAEEREAMLRREIIDHHD